MISNKFHENLNQLRLSNIGCDVLIEIGSKSFLAHRVVLMARIEHFRNMFTADMLDEKRSIISLDGGVIDPIYFDEVLNFIYTSKIEFTFSNIRAIYKTADYFCFDELIDRVQEHVRSNMRLDNICIYRNIAIELRLKSWKSVSSKFSFKHIFIDIPRSSRWPQIPNLSLRTIQNNLEKLQKSERLEDMFHYSVDWALQDPVNRSSMLAEFLKNIPLSKLSFYFLTIIAPQYDLIRNNNECRSLLLDAIIDYNHGYHGMNRMLLYSLYAIGGRDGGELFSVSEYSSLTRQWTSTTPMPYSRTHFDCAVIEHKIYICGGYDGYQNTQCIPDLTVFDTHTRTYSQLPPMKHARQNCAAAVLNGQIYVVGGFNGFNYLKVVERYSVTTYRWINVASMTFKRQGLELVSLNGFLYAIGGFDGNIRLSIVERYDPNTDKWTSMNSTNNRYTAFGSAVMNGKIYIAGSDKCEVYSPEDDRWTEMPAPTRSDYGRRLTVYDGRLYAIGGIVGPLKEWKGMKTVEVYDMKAHVWRPETDMDIARCFHRLAVVRH